MIGHPREELLLAFQDHRLDDRRRRRMAGHLSGCQRCRNVVQAHRTVRGVFALEAPFAPDGVLERALASRAAGTMVLLPVAEPDAPRFRPLPFRPLAIAAGVLLAVFAGVQVIPMTPLRGAWSAWSDMIVEWQPLGGASVIDLRYPDAPVASAAVFQPTRMRAMTARYGIPQFEGRERRYLTMDVRRNGELWEVTERFGELPRLTVRFDTVGLGLVSWTSFERYSSMDITRVYQLERSGSTFGFNESWTGSPPEQFLKREPAQHTTGTSHALLDGPSYVGTASLWVLLGTTSLKLGWAGSITSFYDRSPPAVSDHKRPVTYLVTGNARVTTPLGSFDAWQVHELRPAGVGFGYTLWFRKSDGLMLRTEYAGGKGIRTQFEIESVTYH